VTVQIEYLDLDDVLDLAEALFGGPPAVRDASLLASAVARPQASVFGEDAYPDLWSKAGALLQSMVKNHALVDGNKRLGWLATAVFLEMNGVRVSRASNDDVYEMVMHVASGSHEVEEIGTRLRSLVAKR